ncbi:fumarylacetoacetate hydrolase [Mesobacillus campisalis]|uniref:Fumarylacetoacetate hydrolase n=1 Tax=Mesobacillus campisalis TaxID=1408103 RepID=A0A0M2T1J7_9BACI|nr:fumarylacetoacetate hydrolase family protein [Mesobacillus campisalis]KKK39821.1 fumarylacetoacetate hydrolase [Mesobacillus campisalis]
MKLMAFRMGKDIQLGILSEDLIVNLHAVEREYKKHHSSGSSLPSDLKQLIEQSDAILPYIEELIKFANDGSGANYSLPVSQVEILPPVSNPEKLICVGLNYLDHCKETGLEPPSSPVIFSKYANAIIGEKAAIEIPVNSNQVDYEAELAIVIGKEAKHVSEEEAEEYIFGYTIMNDISARDQQFADGQWSRGKSADTFAPIGPVIVTKDEVGDPHRLDISLTLNGQIMQESNTENLIFNVSQIVSYLSQSMTLRPGDIIATGTPPGVGMGRDPQVWLKDGDNLSVSIEKIGTLTNPVKKATSKNKGGRKESAASL